MPTNGGPATGRSRAAPAAAVLADRLAAALVHHEPGWRLPRLTTLARQYNVSSAEIDTAIGNLAARHLVRRLPDGQVYRASPAEYWVPLEGIIGLASRVHPIGGQLVCASSHTDMRRPPEDIGRALGAAPSDPVLSIRCVWTVGGKPAALASSYVSQQVAANLRAPWATKPGKDAEEYHEQTRAGSPLAFPVPWPPGETASPWPAAVQIEMCPPPPSAAKTLRVAAGQPVATVTLSFPGLTSGTVALTIAMLRPEFFRIVVEAPPPHIMSAFIDDFVGN